MDISQFNQRKNAEDGLFMALKHPYTDEPLGDGGFVIRGVAAKSVQNRLVEMRKAAEDIAKGEDEEAVMERMHRNMIDAALKYIIRGQDLENAGKPVGDGVDDIRAVLEMTFPDMGPVEDENGDLVVVEVEVPDEDGEAKKVKVPKQEFKNKTFAAQVIEFAEDGSRFFGKT